MCISKEDCIRYAVTGPMLRSVGVPLDMRKDEPYLVYDRVDFDVPIGEVGDNYDRYLVCVEEIHQSLRIAEQCVAKLEKLRPGTRQRRRPSRALAGQGPRLQPDGRADPAVQGA